MTITVKVKPNSKVSQVQKLDTSYIVNLHSKPLQGKANSELISLLSKHFEVAKSCIRIVRGVKGRIKVVEIENI